MYFFSLFLQIFIEDAELFGMAPKNDVLIAVFAVRKYLRLLLFRNVCLLNPILTYEEASMNPEFISCRRRISVGLDDR